MNPAHCTASPDLLVSLDRSDRRAAFALRDLGSGAWLAEDSVDLAPDRLDAWWRALVQAHPRARIAVAFEQPAPNLLAFFCPRRPSAIYALNPSRTRAYRQALVNSGARTDQSDARHQGLYVAKHLDELRPWTPPAPGAAQLDRMTRSRRRAVDDRGALTSRLQALLKRYFPQALDLLHEDLWRPMNLAFLRRWPCAVKLQAAPLSRVRRFFEDHGSRSGSRWKKRGETLRGLLPLAAATPADLLQLKALLRQIEMLNEIIAEYDLEIAGLFASVGASAAWISRLPGAGRVLAPRIYCALAIYGPQTGTAERFAAAVGVAPITDRSGNYGSIQRRIRCDRHTRQTFVDWAKESCKHSEWAGLYLRKRQAHGHGFHVILRGLANKWIQILWACWRDGVDYDEAKYIDTLRRKGSPHAPKPTPPSDATSAQSHPALGQMPD